MEEHSPKESPWRLILLALLLWFTVMLMIGWYWYFHLLRPLSPTKVNTAYLSQKISCETEGLKYSFNYPTSWSINLAQLGGNWGKPGEGSTEPTVCTPHQYLNIAVGNTGQQVQIVDKTIFPGFVGPSQQAFTIKIEPTETSQYYPTLEKVKKFKTTNNAGLTWKKYNPKTPGITFSSAPCYHAYSTVISNKVITIEYCSDNRSIDTLESIFNSIHLTLSP